MTLCVTSEGTELRWLTQSRSQNKQAGSFLLKADPKDVGMGLSTFLVPCCGSWPYLVFVIIFPDSKVVSLVPKPA